MPDKTPHSRACGFQPHEHGSSCHTNCPTCHGAATPTHPQDYNLIPDKDTLGEALGKSSKKHIGSLYGVPVISDPNTTEAHFRSPLKSDPTHPPDKHQSREVRDEVSRLFVKWGHRTDQVVISGIMSIIARTNRESRIEELKRLVKKSEANNDEPWRVVELYDRIAALESQQESSNE